MIESTTQLEDRDAAGPTPMFVDNVDVVLRGLILLAEATMATADGVSISLRRDGLLTTAVASSRSIMSVDAVQYESGEGPCVDASALGQAFYSGRLGTESRWPAFTPHAKSVGLGSVLSSPLLLAGRPGGSLNVYSKSISAFPESDQELAGTFATEMSAILSMATFNPLADAAQDRLQSAMDIRQTIAQAQGAIMEREGISAHDAYRELVIHARQERLTLQESAEWVVAATRSLRLDFKAGSSVRWLATSDIPGRLRHL